MVRQAHHEVQAVYIARPHPEPVEGWSKISGLFSILIDRLSRSFHSSSPHPSFSERRERPLQTYERASGSAMPALAALRSRRSWFSRCFPVQKLVQKQPCNPLRGFWVLTGHEISVYAHIRLPIVTLGVGAAVLFQHILDPKWYGLSQAHCGFFRIGKPRHGFSLDERRAVRSFAALGRPVVALSRPPGSMNGEALTCPARRNRASCHSTSLGGTVSL